MLVTVIPLHQVLKRQMLQKSCSHKKECIHFMSIGFRDFCEKTHSCVCRVLWKNTFMRLSCFLGRQILQLGEMYVTMYLSNLFGTLQLDFAVVICRGILKGCLLSESLFYFSGTAYYSYYINWILKSQYPRSHYVLI